MTSQNELINKTYYQSILENKNEHPIKILGEKYIAEMQKEQPELSAIRFAQGEVYFLSQDYEAAIFKWQHPLEESFIPWAQKNIADAHLEMGLLEDAERSYKEVQTESPELKSEVLLQLFSLYIQQKQSGKAVETIKRAIQLNPDYSHITELAQSYFEDIGDWNNGIELAVNEAIRTKSLSWFAVLEVYAERGFTANHEPEYFKNVQEALLELDKYRFECLSEVLWRSYETSDLYISWLEEINQLLSKHTVESSYMWKKLPKLMEKSYADLISGRFLIGDITPLIHTHLKNWLAVSSVTDGLNPSTAIIAWAEIFPSELDRMLVKQAEEKFENAKPFQNGREEGMMLFDSIHVWAEKEGLSDEFTTFIQPIVEEHNMDVASPSKIRHIIQSAIEFLIEQRTEVENTITEEMNEMDELLARVDGMTHQLADMEKEKAENMTNAFVEIKEDFVQHVMEDIPKLLQRCSELVQEDSDFSKLHVEIDKEMNSRIADYIANTSLPVLKNAIRVWLADCKEEFEEMQSAFSEWSEGINQEFKAEKVVLQGDFKILDDWQRDMERMARGMARLEHVNIMMRNNPSKLLLKGAGKLLGSISKSKDMLYRNYKKHIESADYSQITEEIIHPFVQQLDMFEESIEWDSNRFSSNVLEVLEHVHEELRGELDEQKQSLEKMREHPEFYRDPLTFFELRLHQYELVYRIG